jgi:hypothetical protein
MQMKYSSNFINNLSFNDYLELIVKELNDNGYRRLSHGKKYEYTIDINDPASRTLFIYGIEDIEALNYLKNIGLINNGRCPICGSRMSSNQYTYTNRYNSAITFSICQNCCNSHGRGNISQNAGCMLNLIIVAAIIFVFIVLI